MTEQCRQRLGMDQAEKTAPPRRLQVLRDLILIARADKMIQPDELRIIKQIAHALQIADNRG